MGAACRLPAADLFHLYRQGELSVQVHIPSALQALYLTQRIEQVEAGTIADLAIELNERYPGIHDRLMEPDGSLRIIVAHEDPGHPNWIETTGHGQGTMCFRWIRADAHPEPACRVVKHSELA